MVPGFTSSFGAESIAEKITHGKWQLKLLVFSTGWADFTLKVERNIFLKNQLN